MDKLKALLGPVKAFATRWRTPILVLALAGFAIGVVLSFRATGLSLGDLDTGALLLLFLVLAPLNVGYTAVNLMEMARATKVRIGFWEAVKVSAWAMLTELLPIPGAAVVRAGALHQRGASATRSAEVVLGFALLWIAISASAASVAVPGGIGFAILGAAAVIGITAWLGTRFGWRTALVACGLRLVGLVLFALRLFVCFAAINATIEPTQSLIFAFATVLGSASAIVPAGLGVSEGLSALFASQIGVAAGTAFLAAALARFAGFFTNLLVAGAMTALGTRQPVIAAQQEAS